MTGQRKNYIDNLRTICILLLIPYHAAMAFNCWEEGNYILLHPSREISSFIVAVSPWYMSLLFVLAGISARYSLKKRTGKQFLMERVKKLLVPLVIGTGTVIPVMAYFADKNNNDYTGSFIRHYQIFFGRITDFTGYDGAFTVGHLWFLLALMVISLAAFILSLVIKNSSAKTHHVWLVHFTVLGAMLLTRIELAGEKIATYFVLYLIGYYLLSDDRFIEKLRIHRLSYLICFAAASGLNVYFYLWSGWTNDVLSFILTVFSGWFGIAAAFAYGKQCLDQSNRVSKYMASVSFDIYILHFVWVVIFQYYLQRVVDHPLLNLMITTICSFAVTMVCCFVITKIKRAIKRGRSKQSEALNKNSI